MKYQYLGLIVLAACSVNKHPDPVVSVSSDQVVVVGSNTAPVVSSSPVETVIPSVCPNGMIEVEGQYCPTVRQDCLKWIDDMRCAEFKKPSICLSARQHKHFCMDKFEWPNVEGSFPQIGMTGFQAEKMCRDQGKRLCSESEFNFACEGEDMLPYTYGYVRDASSCNIDKQWRDYTKYSRSQWDKLYQAVASDSKSKCVSPFGIYNLNGNVDEWVGSESPMGYRIVLKSGYFGPIRARCRPSTRSHNPQTFSFYQIGFRCCKNAN